MKKSETWNWFDGKRLTMETAYFALMDGQAIRNKIWEKNKYLFVNLAKIRLILDNGTETIDCGDFKDNFWNECYKLPKSWYIVDPDKFFAKNY